MDLFSKQFLVLLVARETCDLVFTLTLFVVIRYDYKIETSTVLTLL